MYGSNEIRIIYKMKVFFRLSSMPFFPVGRAGKPVEVTHEMTNPSRIEWDLTNGPLSKLLELLDTQVWGSVQWVLLEISWN